MLGLTILAKQVMGRLPGNDRYDFRLNWHLVSVSNYSISHHLYLCVRNDGTVWCWGGNDEYQLGDNTNTNRSTAVQVGNW